MAYSFIPDILTEDLTAEQKELTAHPLWTTMAQGQATRGLLRIFALQDAWLVRHSLQLEALLLAHAPDERSRATLARKLTPKAVFAGAGSLLHFGAALGLSEADFQAAAPLPGCLALTSYFYYALSRHGFLGLLASVAASESVFIRICDQVSPGLRQHYGFSEEQVAFFPLHDGLKASVDGGEAELLRSLAVDGEQRALVTRVVRETYGAERLFYDTVLAAAEDGGVSGSRVSGSGTSAPAFR